MIAIELFLRWIAAEHVAGRAMSLDVEIGGFTSDRADQSREITIRTRTLRRPPMELAAIAVGDADPTVLERCALCDTVIVMKVGDVALRFTPHDADPAFCRDLTIHRLRTLERAAATELELLDRITTIADEAFGPFPVQTPSESLTAIERGIFDQRQRIAELERAIAPAVEVV